MKRTKLIDRSLPDYTKGEEIFNMVSHIVGGGMGVIIFALCVIKSFINGANCSNTLSESIILLTSLQYFFAINYIIPSS